MAGLSQPCNHVTACLFRVETAIRAGPTNPCCTSKSNEWLPNRIKVQPMKLKDINFERSDFGKRGKKQAFACSPKKKYNPLASSKEKLLTLTDVAEAVEGIETALIWRSAVPKPKAELLEEPVKTSDPRPTNVASVDDILLISSNVQTFFDNLQEAITQENIEQIEQLTKGQHENANWHIFRKYVITASKGHEVLIKMRKIQHTDNKSLCMLCSENIWLGLCQSQYTSSKIWMVYGNTCC